MAKCPECTEELFPKFRELLNSGSLWQLQKYWFSHWFLRYVGFMDCIHCGAGPLTTRYRDIFALLTTLFLPPLIGLELLVLTVGQINDFFLAVVCISIFLLFVIWGFYWYHIWWSKIAQLQLIKGSTGTVIFYIWLVIALAFGIIFGIIWLLFLLLNK